MSKEILYLVDGTGYIFRAFYAITALSNKSGFPTNALYGFVRMLKKLIEEAKSEHVVVVFDAGKETFRNELYPEYKANRDECPEDLKVQMPYFRSFVTALGLPVLELPGFEADDILGTLAKRLVTAGHTVVIVSGDKDLMQLVEPEVSIWDTMKDKYYRAAEVEEKFGVSPDKVIEILALMGDSSDNIPGLKGVGPKTATQLVKKFNNIEELITNVEELKGDRSIRGRDKIAAQIELEPDLLRLCKQLVSIKTDVPVSIDRGDKIMSLGELGDSGLLEALTRHPADLPALQKLIDQFEFGSLLSDLNLSQTKSIKGEIDPDSDPEKGSGISEIPAFQGAKYKTIWAKEFDQFVGRISKVDLFAFDLETTSLDVLEAQIVGASFCWSKDEAFYVPLQHFPPKSESNLLTLTNPGEASIGNSSSLEQPVADQLSVETFLSKMGDVFSSQSQKKCGQNLKYDVEVLNRHGIVVHGIASDTMLGAYLLAPDKGSYNLTVLARQFLQADTIEFEEVLGGQESFQYVPVADATRYACQDAHYAWLISEILTKALKENKLIRVYEEIEVPLVEVLASMELEGIKLDVNFLAKMSESFEADITALRTQVHNLAGTEFNLNSPKQLSEVLFDKLGLSTKGLKRTKTGVSTDSSVLEKLQDLHPLPGLLLQHRFLHKLKSTYIDALPAQVSRITGRLHTRFNQTGTATGRLSSSDPNLQNIPVSTPEGRKIREAFVADQGSVLISADYSQIELRILAHMSGDESLINAFQNNRDIHTETARELFRLGAFDQVTSDQRRFGKTINFGIVYGMGGYRLSRELGIPLKEANEYIERYFTVFSGVRKFFDRLEQDATQNGYVSTIFGRRRIVSDIDGSGRDGGFAIRAAMNAPLQGSAADIIKVAMIRLARRIGTEQLNLRMLLQIHDELVFECSEALLEEMKPIILNEMEGVVELAVPLKVELGSGKNWLEAH